MSTPEPRLPGVSTREAAIILGTSQSDVLRRIRRGELKAESIPRPGGTMLRVLIDAPGAAPEATPDATLAAVQGLSDALASEREERQRLAEENADLRERVGRAEAASEAHQTRASLESARADDLAVRLAESEAKLARPWWKWW